MKTRILSLLIAFWTTWSSASIIDRNPPVDTPVPTPRLSAELIRTIGLAKKYGKGQWEVFGFNTLSGSHNYKTNKFETQEAVVLEILSEIAVAANGSVSAMNRAEQVKLNKELEAKGWSYTSRDGTPYLSVYLRPNNLDYVFNKTGNIGIPGTGRRETIHEYYMQFTISYDYERKTGTPHPRNKLEPKIQEMGTIVFYCTEDSQMCWNHGTYIGATQIRWTYPPNYEDGAINSAGGGG